MVVCLLSFLSDYTLQSLMTLFFDFRITGSEKRGKRERIHCSLDCVGGNIQCRLSGVFSLASASVALGVEVSR